jgi:NAD(P)-dependent dehydrogenase (short-subunit alcohol dehydrogenase family)
LKSPVVLITGALTGIGRAAALEFASEHARILVSGRHEEAGQTLAQELRAKGAEALFQRADVRLEDEVRSLIDRAVAQFGRLDVAVNNAATEGPSAFVTEQSVENYHTTFDTNVLGMLLGLKHQLRIMQPQGSGSIINISSSLGQRGRAGGALYSASKHAVEGLTRSAALEAAAHGVRVNAVAPGPIDTDMFTRFSGTAERKSAMIASMPLKRMGRPEEVAQTIVFLASDKASFITGQIIGVDGGRMA